MEISVVVPFYNALPFLEVCADSLRAQIRTGGEVEILFVDARSTDGSADFLKRKFPEIQTLRSESRNPYLARNLGARAARGRILGFTDADCSIGARWLQAIREGFSQEADLVTGPVHPHPAASSTLRQVHDCENTRMEWMCSSAKVAYAYSNNLAITAGLFWSMGGFDATRPRGGDSDFLQRALEASPSLVCAFRPRMSVTHLEMTSLQVWLRKKFLYGRSGTAGRSRPLDLGSLGPQKKSPLFSSALLLALASGRLAYSAGRMLRTNRVRRCLLSPGSGS